MRNLQREILLLLPEDLHGEDSLKWEADSLEKILNKIDTIEQTAPVVEYVNLHRGGITQKRLRVEAALRRSVLSSFQFIIHKN